jgi:hypothetical protein
MPQQNIILFIICPPVDVNGTIFQNAGVLRPV